MNSDLVDRETKEKESKFAEIITEAKSVAAELPIFDLDFFPEDQYDSKILPRIIRNIEHSFGRNLAYRRLGWSYTFIIGDQRKGKEMSEICSSYGERRTTQVI